MNQCTRAIIRQGDRFLLLKKRHNKLKKYANKWEPPGGKVNAGENPRIAVLRELKEETSLNGKIIKKLPTITLDNEINHVFHVKVDNYKIILSKEHSKFGWLSLNKIKRFKDVDTAYPKILVRYVNYVM